MLGLALIRFDSLCTGPIDEWIAQLIQRYPYKPE